MITKDPYNEVTYSVDTLKDLFGVDDAGNVYLKVSQVGRTQNQYQFQVSASDGGNPANRIEGTFTLNVLRNNFPSVILNLPQTIEIPENRLVDTLPVFDVQADDNDPSISTHVYDAYRTSRTDLKMDVFRICCIFCLILDRTVFGLQLVSKGKFITSIGIFNDQSSWTPDKAIDGDAGRNPDTCKCCAATRNTLEPWYSLDLGQSYAIRRINVLGRETNQCSFGRYGEKCTGVCGQCYRNFPCDPVSGDCSACARGYKPHKKCTDECDDGHYGWHCIGKCGNCYNNEACDKVSGRCKKCAAGYNDTMCIEECGAGRYGLNCTERCGNCSKGYQCNHINGSCPNGCASRYQGELCKNMCPGGFYGDGCKSRCGACYNKRNCDSITGHCLEGCEPGFNGSLCVDICPAGYYGANCASACGECSGLACQIDTGVCPEGCIPGYSDKQCKVECEEGTYGEGCTSICGNCHGNEICNKQNGTCQACECGYTGHDCKGEINSAASRGECPTCNIAMIVGGTLVSILAIEGVAAALFLLIRKRRRSLKNGTMNRSNTYELPNRGINEGEHEYESAIELDVNTNAFENTGHQAT